MNPIFLALLFVPLVGCHVPPTLPDEGGGELVLTVTGEAPGILDCVLENRSDSNWYTRGYSNSLLRTVQYWDGSDWKTPLKFFCGTGVIPRVIEPGSKWRFQEYAKFSQPRVVVATWRNWSRGDSYVEIVGLPQFQSIHNRPFEPEADIGDGTLEWANQLRLEQREKMKDR